MKITSGSNPNFKRWIGLLESKGIKKNGQFLLFGEKVIREAVLRHTERISEAIGLSPRSDLPREVKQHELSKELFQQLNPFAAGETVLVMDLPEIPRWKNPPVRKGLTVLCPLGDPANVGALIRSAAAFGADEFVLLKESAHPFHPKSVRSASGALFDIRFSQGPSIRELSGLENCYALDMKGQPISEVNWPARILLLVGEEGPGIGKLEGIQKVAIPMQAKAESLNASHAAAIALFTIYQKKRFDSAERP